VYFRTEKEKQQQSSYAKQDGEVAGAFINKTGTAI
jgi:hypothetical protein